MPRGGHSDFGLDRINLTSVPNGWDESDAFVDLADTLLSLDADLVFVDDTDLHFGPFGIEPRHRRLLDELERSGARHRQSRLGRACAHPIHGYGA